uniref:Phage tail assembly chaperone n=1 Tax=Rhodopseudomonas palustris (strain BisA53) TaxID=316055 RepID=Q07QC1_RHOP5
MTPSSIQPFPWDAAMRFGFGILQLSPAAFWSLTPRELACAIRARRGEGGAPLDRAAFDQLMRRFPDHAAAEGEVR